MLLTKGLNNTTKYDNFYFQVLFYNPKSATYTLRYKHLERGCKNCCPEHSIHGISIANSERLVYTEQYKYLHLICLFILLSLLFCYYVIQYLPCQLSNNANSKLTVEFPKRNVRIVLCDFNIIAQTSVTYLIQLINVQYKTAMLTMVSNIDLFCMFNLTNSKIVV